AIAQINGVNQLQGFPTNLTIIMPPLNKKRCQLKAARKSKGKRARSEKNRTVCEYDKQDDYEQINEKLNDHMWVDEDIDERAAD
ncbi:17881_t:CDS:1, partial [Cetraspora pellucida]